MQIEHIALAIRPRNAWEAIDLGTTLLQTHWRAFLPIWLSIVLPLVALIYGLLLLIAEPWLAAFIVWWLKPVYDRICLYFFSHAVFSEIPTVRQTFRALPSLLFKLNLLTSLTLGRLTLSRSFILPIAQLEGLTGRSWYKRMNLLHKKNRRFAFWLTTICLHFEWILYFALFALVILMVPDIYTRLIWDSIFGQEETIWWVDLMGVVFNMIVLTIIEPLYVVSGFTLYLNCRTHLEGWDIELLFHRIATRLQSALFGLLTAFILLLTLLSYPPPAAALTPTQAQHDIQTILADDDFNDIDISGSWYYIGEQSSSNTVVESNSAWLDFLHISMQIIALLVEYSLWLIVLVFIIGILFYYRRYWHLLIHKRNTKTNNNHASTLMPFLKHVAAPDLPENPAEYAWQLWQQGQAQAALSLLYRAALSELKRQELPIKDSYTEAECIALAQQHCPAATSQYFANLTYYWQQIAYAERLPPAAAVENLCQDWTVFFPHPQA